MVRSNNPPRICRGWDDLAKLLRKLLFALKLTFAIMLLGAFIAALFYLRIPPAQTSFNQYQQANTCPEQETCRRIVNGIVFESKTIKISFRIPAGRTSSKTVTNIQYVITVNLENGQQKKAVILPDLSIQKELFGINAYLPETWLDENFAEDYFPERLATKVEIWQGEIVALYTNDVHGYAFPPNSANITFFPPDEPANKTTSFTNIQDTAAEIFIPTINHPRMILFQAQEEFNAILYGFIFLGLLTFIAAIGLKQ